ncbi:MAG: lipopolysaccharide heptosyltransferase II [Deltaproteobacteria bacterium]|nr:lipopolysaccharide heptosyltransferase II [Deltaproteobacteria bacterium]MCL4874834.1 lipopolysaccharide heptosyltransferase II [bacterium]
MRKEGGKKVLVRVPNWIGDAVMCLPALEALKGLYPSSNITVLAKSKVIPIFANNPAISEILEFGSKKGGILGNLSVSSELKGRGFDTALLFQNAFEAAFLSFLSRIPERVGYARDLRSAFLTKAVPVIPEVKRKHQVFYYLSLVEALGRSVDKDIAPVPKLYISKEEAGWARGFLKENGISGRPLFGAAPGASYGPAKMWPPERFASVLNELAEARKGAALVFGGPDDREACGALKRAYPRALDLSGALSLRQSMSLMSLLDAFITNDSGPMHISAALGVPTIAIFGSTDSVLTGPVGKKTAVVGRKMECSPCFKRECKFGHYECLRAIKADEVLKAAKGLVA